MGEVEGRNTDHCAEYTRLPEDKRAQIDRIVEEVMTRIIGLSAHFAIKKIVMPKVETVLDGFFKRVNTERFSENEIAILLMEIWKKINQEFKIGSQK